MNMQIKFSESFITKLFKEIQKRNLMYFYGNHCTETITTFYHHQ